MSTERKKKYDRFVNSKIYKKFSLRAGFEPARGDPIGFQVQRLNHSAITAVAKSLFFMVLYFITS